MRLLLVVAAASFLKILSPTLISPYGLPGPPPPGGVCSQFRALLLPIFRFFRLSPSSSFRLTLPLSLAVGSVTLFGNRLQFGRFCSRPDFCSLFSSALLLSLSFRPPLSLSLSCFLCSLPFFLRLCPSSFFYPFPFSVRFSVGFSADFSAGTSVRATFARGPGGSFSSFGHRLRIIGFLHRVHGDESGDIFVADVVSDRLAFLSNLTAPGQLEHSSTGVIQFACCCTRRVRSEVSRGKINRAIGL